MRNRRLTKKQQDLVSNNLRLLRGFIINLKKRRFISPRIEDDLISELCWNFCISASKYDEDYGVKFSTYAYWGFNKSVKEICGRKKRNIDRHNFCSIDRICDDIDTKVVFSNTNELKVKKDFLYNIVDKVDVKERDKKIFIEYYSYKISQEKLGEKYNLTRNRIHQIIFNILNKLKRIMRILKLSKQDFYVRD